MNEDVEKTKRINRVNCVFLATIVLSVLASFLPASIMEGRALVQVVVPQLLFAAPAIIFLIREKLSYREEVKLYKMKISNILLSILFGFLIQPVLTLINAISLSFTTNAASSFMIELSEQIPWYLSVILVALVPCILEESVYRGVFYQEYRRVSMPKAVVLSGFLFGLMHGNLNQFCYAFAMGMIFALLIEATGSIVSTMVIHFMINAGSVISIYLLPKSYELIQTMVKLQENIGETELADYMKEFLTSMGGGMDISASEWMHTMLDVASAETGMTLGTAIGMYGPSAVLFGTLAFMLFRRIAKKNGTWEKIRCAMSGEKPENEAEESRIEEAEEVRLMTVPLMIAIAIGVISIFVYETMMILPR